MASNVITAVIPKLLAQGLMALRENAVTPRLVANKTSSIAGKKGSTLDVPVPSILPANTVTPATTAPAGDAIQPLTVPVTLDQWYEAAFDLSDDEIEEAMDGVLPMQASEAVRAIVNTVDGHLLGLHTKFQGAFGTAGTIPMSNISDGTGVRKVLNKQLAPMDNRNVIIDPEAEAKALALEQFANVNFSGSVDAIREGRLNRKLGMDWWMNQNIPEFTGGTLDDGNTTREITVNNGAGYAAGTKTIAFDEGANTTLVGTVKVGDRFTFTGHKNQYVITAAATAAGNDISISFYPGLEQAVVDDEIAVLDQLAGATGTVNQAFHRDCIAFANRPLIPAPAGLGAISLSATDPVSGLALRIEVTREYKRTRWSYDFLWGANVIRPELGAVLWG